MTETPDIRSEETSSDTQIVQLIPANGWVAVYKDDDTELRAPLVAWALRRDGEVIPLDTDPEGDVGDPRKTRNFHRVERVTDRHN
ncbi:hypothetical protein [Promicromonospora iranensis]|uniref:Uncharacterized protein n=1 Tax=Promicromonospora iranensis TaxID=1105144 RepID=A0ABU2CIF3_9MICO|nr:hypothetical protein [Promicromonospora iranensis]MDR7381114.1 hypothetical protein [Promicromonospora iranensis]